MNKVTRPSWEEITKNINGYIACSCMSILKSIEEVRTHWEAGHFDIWEEPEITGAYVTELEEKLEKAKEALRSIRHQLAWDEMTGTAVHTNTCPGCIAKKTLEEIS